MKMKIKHFKRTKKKQPLSSSSLGSNLSNAFSHSRRKNDIILSQSKKIVTLSSSTF